MILNSILASVARVVQLSLPPQAGATVCGRPLECITPGHCGSGATDLVVSCGTNNLCSYFCNESVCAPARPAWPHDVKKNRYLSFVPSNGTESVVAYRVKLTASEYFGGAVGTEWWVGVPVNGISSLVPISEAAPERPWPEQVIQVTGCEIVPVATYEIRGALTGGSVLSNFELVVQTIEKPGVKFWGDTVGSFNGSYWTAPQGTVNIDDAVAVIKTWQGLTAPNAAPVSWVDVEPTMTNRLINFNDVFAVLLAFVGTLEVGQYGPPRFCDPADCENCPGLGCCPCVTCMTGNIDFSLTPDTDLIEFATNPSREVVIDVFTDSASDVAAYEMSLEVLGGDTGSLDVTALEINKTRGDYIFLGKTIADQVDDNVGRLGAAINDGSSVEVTAGNGYLGGAAHLDDVNWNVQLASQFRSHCPVSAPPERIDLPLLLASVVLLE